LPLKTARAGDIFLRAGHIGAFIANKPTKTLGGAEAGALGRPPPVFLALLYYDNLEFDGHNG